MLNEGDIRLSKPSPHACPNGHKVEDDRVVSSVELTING